MKKLFYIFIPIIFIDILFDGDQFVKLPYLFAHFTEHHNNDNLSFIEFLVIHYSNHQHASQSKEHNKLPFKDHQNCIHIHYYTDKVQKVEIIKFYAVLSSYPITYCSLYAHHNYSSVWHPPEDTIA